MTLGRGKPRSLEKGLDSKVKLDLYRRFGGKREFKKYLHGRSDGARRLSLDPEHMV